VLATLVVWLAGCRTSADVVGVADVEDGATIKCGCRNALKVLPIAPTPAPPLSKQPPTLPPKQ
jgi:hypothetical protein